MAKKTTLRTPKINEQGEKEYDYIYPQTLADIVHLEDGTSVEDKIRELEENSGGLTTDNTTPYEVVDDYNPAHKKYVDTAISQAISGVEDRIIELEENSATIDDIDTAISQAITGVLEGEV